MKRLIPLAVLLLAFPALAFGWFLFSAAGGGGGSTPAWNFVETFEASEYDTAACGSAPCISFEDGDGDKGHHRA